MVDRISEFKNILDIKDEQEQRELLIKMSLEAIASESDYEIMINLMFDAIYHNSVLNRKLEQQVEENRRLSITDTLTGLYNRRHFIEVLEGEIQRYHRSENPFALLMFDIDHFKQINDTYGHDIGDYVLKSLSEFVMSRLRRTDVLARWGGEEFMIILPETNKSQSELVAEVIRKGIESYDFSPVPEVTCSFGIYAVMAGENPNMDLLTKSVDQALYVSKENGRNRITTFCP